jgi:cholesterol oxidase
VLFCINVYVQYTGLKRYYFADVLLGTKTTVHILGGAVKGKVIKTGVINKNYHVFGYKNRMVCDSSIISANPRVNPSLSITAISEYAMSKISEKN